MLSEKFKNSLRDQLLRADMEMIYMLIDIRKKDDQKLIDNMKKFTGKWCKLMMLFLDQIQNE